MEPKESEHRLVRFAMARSEQVRKATEKELFATRVALGMARAELSQLRAQIALARRTFITNTHPK